MNKLEELTSTMGFKKFMAKLYGIGAAVVIAGALFKILHWPGANIMLIVGMGTETVIFFFSAFEPIHGELDWTLVYPELAGMHGEERKEEEEEEEKKPLTEQLDNMLEKAKIGPELMESLGSGLRSLSEQTSKITSLTDATVATNDFATNMKSATQKIGGLSDAYDKASTSISGSISDLERASSKTSQALELITSSTEQQANSYSEQLQKFSRNLGSLNSEYELQAQTIQRTTKLYEGFEKAAADLGASAEEAKKFKNQMASLAENLASLNMIYGNILSAMSFKK